MPLRGYAPQVHKKPAFICVHLRQKFFNMLSITHHKNIEYCTYCPKLCRFACPVALAEGRETVTPTERMRFLHLLRNGAADWNDEIADIFYRCLGCLSCRAFCKHRIDVSEVMLEARRTALDRKIEPVALKRLITNFSHFQNPYGNMIFERVKNSGVASRVGRDSKIIYFIGCVTLYHFHEIINAVEKVLTAAGIDFTIHGGEAPLCCGLPALLSGDVESFLRTARKNAGALKKHSTILTTCPGCMVTLKNHYEKHGVKLNADIIHFTQFTAGLVEKGRIKLKDKREEKVMYHDPCYLGKHLGIFEPPRLLLNEMFYPDRVIEFSWNRDKNMCCGGSGLLPVVAPQTSIDISARRLREFKEQSPAILATACPTCERAFARADENIAVRDVAVLVAEQIG
ncbi:MAG: (Fe-S)-binding protein [bacterium]